MIKKTYEKKSGSLPVLFLFIVLLLMSSVSVSDEMRATAATGAVVISEVTLSNVRDVSFTVFWITDQDSDGRVQYGTDPANLSKSVDDDRGAATTDDTHYVTISKLSPETTYYFDVVSAGTTDNNGGAHYSITTGPTLGLPSPDTIFGQVFQSNGTTVAEGTIVQITLRDHNGMGSSGNAAPLSALVADNGYWNVDLGDTRLSDHTAYFEYSPNGDEIVIEAQGARDGTATQITDTAKDRPAPNMTLTLLTTTPTATAVASSTPTATAVASSTPTATAVASSTPTATAVATSTPTATAVATSTPTATAVATSTPTATEAVATSTPTATEVVASSTPTATEAVASSTPTATEAVASSTPTATEAVASSTPTATGTVAINTPTVTMTISPIKTSTLTASQQRLYLPVILRQ